MANIRLISGNTEKTVRTEKGTSLLSLIRDNGFFIEALCSGEGKCGKCTVNINGNPQLACKKMIDADISVIIPDSENIFQDNKIAAPSGYGNLNPIIKKIILDINKDEREPYLSDFEFIGRLLRKQGITVSGPDNIPLIAEISRISHLDKKAAIFLTEKNQSYEIIDISENYDEKNVGLAIDIGTTTVSITLIDLENGRLANSISFYNPQIIYGADIIHRIIFAQKNENHKLLKDRLIDEIQMAIRHFFVWNQVQPDEIKAVAVSGNTTMIHFFLGLPSRFIREEPYSPAARSFPPLKAFSTLNLLNKSRLFILPCPRITSAETLCPES